MFRLWSLYSPNNCSQRIFQAGIAAIKLMQSNSFVLNSTGNIFQISYSSVICFEYQTRRNFRQFVQLICIVCIHEMSDKFLRTLNGWRLLKRKPSYYRFNAKTLFLPNNLLKNLHNRETLHVFFWVNNIVVVVVFPPVHSKNIWNQKRIVEVILWK